MQFTNSPSMKKQLLLALTTLAFAINAHALTGGFSYSGGYAALDAGGNPVMDLTLATQVKFGNIVGGSPSVSRTNGLGTGSFAAIPDGTQVIYNNLILKFLPTANTPLVPFFTLPGITFDLNTISRDYVTPMSLVLNGTGTFTSGSDSSPGIYTATFNTISGSFSYSASAGVPVPDGGSALALLGMSLVGVEALRRKFAI
jgi:VPDSG-CTERM motif